MVLVHRSLWEDVYTKENIDYQQKNNNLLSSTANQNYYVNNCQFKSLPNRAIYLSTTSTSNIILISRSLFHSCSVSNAQGGSIYIKGGSIVYYQICAINISINADDYTKGDFSYSESSEGLQILNYMNESTIAEGGNIDAGNSVDSRFNGYQHYKSNNCSNCISSYFTYDFRPENTLT